jgi:heat shock protein HslJ
MTRRTGAVFAAGGLAAAGLVRAAGGAVAGGRPPAGGGPGAAALEGTAWTAEAYNNGRGDVVSLVAGTAITARFEGGRVGGSASCNSYSAPYTLAGPAVEIGPAISTRRACTEPPGIMEQELAYLAALEAARAYRIDGNRLILETAAGTRAASFVPAAAGP